MKYETINTVEELRAKRDAVINSWDDQKKQYYRKLKENFRFCDNAYEESKKKKESEKQIKFAKFKQAEALDQLIEFERNNEVLFLAKSYAHTQSKKLDRAFRNLNKQVFKDAPF